MWPFSKKPDDLAEILVKEMEILAWVPGDWKKTKVLVYEYYKPAIKHECGNAITRYGSLVSANGDIVTLSDKQEARLKSCYDEIITTWALSSCIKKAK